MSNVCNLSKTSKKVFSVLNLGENSIFSIAVLILAAGRGLRAGGDEPKQYVSLGGAPLIRRTVQIFFNHGIFSPIVVVIQPQERKRCIQALGNLASHVLMIDGGETRQDSTYAGLLSLGSFSPHYVYVHDGARPFVSSALLERIHSALTPGCGVLPVLPVSDALKLIDKNGQVAKTVARRRFFAAQTPQAFPYTLLLEIHKAAHSSNLHDFSDDSALAEWKNIPVRIIKGTSENIKITWAEDIKMAERRVNREENVFPDIRTGNGYDVHRLEVGDRVTLCGVKIPWDQKLVGHSDADVALHALTDALLATCGERDIGAHFSSQDPRWKGESSALFVRYAKNLVYKKNGRILNIDITLIAEAPEIRPYHTRIVNSLQKILTLSPERISFKATTNEKLGFIGRQEGIAAIATAAVFYGYVSMKIP